MMTIRPSAEGYTYSVSLHLGGTGNEDARFESIEGYNVDMSEDGRTITFSGLEYGSILNIPVTSLVEVDGSQYAVIGMRQSGKDELVSSNISVTRDGDYVVAYGVGEVVPYAVKYVDEAGNNLYDEQIFYGIANQEVSVSYRYIDGYIPNTYNYHMQKLTKPSVDESGEYIRDTFAEFVFQYKEGYYSIENTVYSTEISYVGGETSYQYITSPGTVQAAQGGNQAANQAAGGQAEQAEDVEAGENNDGAVVIPDEGVPTAVPEEIVEIEDNDIPLFGNNITISLAVIYGLMCIAAATAAVLVLKTFFKKKQNKNK